MTLVCIAAERISAAVSCRIVSFELKNIIVTIFQLNIYLDTIAGREEVLEVEEGDAGDVDGDGEYQESGVNHCVVCLHLSELF